MKKTQLLMIFLLVSGISIAFAQKHNVKKTLVKPTKEETESWIISKFNDYKNPSVATWDLSFSNDDIIIKVGLQFNNSINYVYSIIHIKEIESMNYSYYEPGKTYSLNFKARNDEKLFIISNNYPPKDYIEYKNELGLPFSITIEENNMKNRIYQAFERLLEIHGVKFNKVKEVF